MEILFLLLLASSLLNRSSGSTCSCNGLTIDGKGECKTEFIGKSFCYVNQGKCSDEKISKFAGQYWSYSACGKGTPVFPKSFPYSSSRSTCECSGLTMDGKDLCTTKNSGMLFCFVNQGTCTDETKSKYAGLYISYSACGYRPQVNCPNRCMGFPPNCFSFEDNTAYFGNNFKCGQYNPKHSLQACQESCYGNSECEFWTWDKETTFCYLKHTRGNVTPQTRYASGSKQCKVPDMDVVYPDFQPQTAGFIWNTKQNWVCE